MEVAYSEFLLYAKPFFQIAPKEECEEGLTKLFGCSACQGIPSIKPCSNFCLNVMRGCLAYHSELGESWDKFVGKLLHEPLKFRNLGSGTGNSTAVEYPPCDQEVMGLNPAGYCLFLSLSLPRSSGSLNGYLKKVQHHQFSIKDAKPFI